MTSLVWNLIINDRGSAGVTSFRNQLERARRASDENGFSLARSSEKMGKFATTALASTGKIAAFTVAAAHAAPAVAGVAGAVVSASGALGVLPGAIAAVAIAQATFKVGTDGMADALKLAAEGGDKYKEALGKLAPEQAKFVKALAGQADAVSVLKRSVGVKMFSGLSNEVKPLASVYLPMIQSALGKTAVGFNATGKQLAGWLKQGSTVSKFNSLLHNSATIADDFLGLIKPIGAGLLNIFTASSGKLVGMTENVGKLGDSFERWTEKITEGGKGGKFGVWVDNGIATLKQFGAVAMGVGKIIASIFSAGGGGKSGTSGLDRLVLTLDRVNDAVNTPAFQGGLKKIFDAIASSSEKVSAALPGFLAALAKLAPTFANILAAGGSSFGATLNSIGQIISVVAPIVNSFSNALGPLAPIFGTLVPYIFLFSKALAGWKIIGPVIAATKAWIVVQGGLNAVLIANPVGLVIAAVALLVTGLVIAYKKSDTFRAVVNAAFKATANFVLGAIGSIIDVFGSLFGVLSKLPGKAGRAFKSAQQAAERATGKVNELKASINTLHGKQVNILVKTTYRDDFESEKRRDVSGRRGANAEGGQILAGAASIVGERGPEISMPATSRTILPAGITAAIRGGGGSGGARYYITINVQGNVLATKRELKALILEALESGPAGGVGRGGSGGGLSGSPITLPSPARRRSVLPRNRNGRTLSPGFGVG